MQRSILTAMLPRKGFLLGVALMLAASANALGQSHFTPRPSDRLGAAAPLSPYDAAAEWPSDAASPDLQSDPPPGSFGERVFALLEGRMQLESGYSFAYDRVGDSHATQHVIPDMLLRYGLTDRLELRIGWPGFVSTHYDGSLSDLSHEEVLNPNVGVMYDLFPQRDWLPQTAVLASVPINLQGNPLTMESFQPLSQVLYCWGLTDQLTLGGTTGMALFRNANDNFTQIQQTASLDWTMSDRVAGFLEWETLIDCGSDDDGTQHLLSGGLSFLLTDRFQFTCRVGGGLNDRAPDFVTGIYFAYRM